MRATGTGDPINDARNAERVAFNALQRSLNRLAAIPLREGYACERARRRIRDIKAAWWAALMARDAADGFTNPCGGVDGNAPSGLQLAANVGLSRKAEPDPSGVVEGPTTRRTGIKPGPQGRSHAVDLLTGARPI